MEKTPTPTKTSSKRPTKQLLNNYIYNAYSIMKTYLQSLSFSVAKRPFGRSGKPSLFGRSFIMVQSTKKCSKCGEEKTLSEFHKQKGRGIGIASRCKPCSSVDRKEKSHSKQFFVLKTYGTQKRSSKERGHPMPDYTREQLKSWLFSQDLFHELHKKWAESDYDTNKRPSVDRKDDYKPYTLSNIQLMTWGGNRSKHHADRKRGANTKISLAVIQMDLDGNVIKEHHSFNSAAREMNIISGHIGNCARGHLDTTRGFRWAYKDAYLAEKAEKVRRKRIKNRTSGMSAVIQMDMNGNKIAEFKSVKDASKETGLLRQSISSCCTGKQKTSGGHKWKYAKENLT